MQMTLGNGATQTSIGWDQADIETLHSQFISAGFVDVSPFTGPDGSSYVMAQAEGTASATLWSGSRVDSRVGPGGVYLGYNE